MLFEVEDKLNEINILRGIGVLAVLLIHITSSSVSHDYYSYVQVIYGSFNAFLNFAVPLFMFLSAFSLTYAEKQKNDFQCGKFYKKRFSKVLFPYLFWVFVYVLYSFFSGFESINYFENTGEFIWNYIFLGKACYHLYFVPVVIQLYLIFPILWYFLSKAKNTRYFRTEKSKNVHILIMFTLISIMLTLLQYSFMEINAEYIYQNFKNTATIVFSYLLPIGMGLWIGYNWYDWKMVKNYARIIIYPICAITGFIFIRYSVLGDTFGLTTRVIGLFRNVYVTFIILVFLDIASLFAKRNNILNKFLIKLSENSLTLYFIHPLVIYFISDLGWFKFCFFNNDFLDYSINLGFRFVAVLGYSYFLTKLISEFKVKMIRG